MILNEANQWEHTFIQDNYGTGLIYQDEWGNRFDWEVIEVGTPSGYSWEWKESEDKDHKVTGTITNTYTYKEKHGYLKIYKHSSVNQKQGLVGAEFKVYSDANCKNLVTTLTTDLNGNAGSKELPAGEYWIEETKAPAAFYIDRTVHEVVINAGETKAITSNEPPKMDPVGIFLKKHDANTGENIALGDSSLAGAEYTIKYYQELLKDPNTNPETVEEFKSFEEFSIAVEEYIYIIIYNIRIQAKTKWMSLLNTQKNIHLCCLVHKSMCPGF